MVSLFLFFFSYFNFLPPVNKLIYIWDIWEVIHKNTAAEKNQPGLESGMMVCFDSGGTKKRIHSSCCAGWCTHCATVCVLATDIQTRSYLYVSYLNSEQSRETETAI